MVVDALNILEDFSITQLVVVDEGVYQGVLHLHDILKKEYYNGKKKLKRNVVLDHLEELRWLLVRSTIAI
jgi:CBS domain-containing protein